MATSMQKTAAGLGQLSVQLFALSGGVNTAATHAVRKAVIVAGQAVVSKTPVDTGRAKGNWITSVDFDDKSIRDPWLSGSQAVADVPAQAAKFNAALHTGIYLNNNLPYMQKLNGGTHSTKAPAGFVETAVQQGINAVRFRSPYVDAGVLSS